MIRVRWTTFLLGAWLAGSLAMATVATQNFYTVDRLLASSPSAPFREFIGQVQTPHGREVLRYLSSELNRLYFSLWNDAQLVLGVLCIWLLSGDSRVSAARRIAVGMLAIVVVMTVWLAPAITDLGRVIDFVPRTPPPPELGRFGMLHAAYSGLEIGKMIMGLVLAVTLIRADR